MEKYYQLSIEEIAKKLDTNPKIGLSSNEAKKRLNQFGPNSLKESPKKSILLIFLSQFTNFLVIILLIASLLSFFLGDFSEGLLIMAILMINAVLGFVQQYRAEKAIADLKKLMSTVSLVYRDGEPKYVSSKDLVPGDLILLEEGQKVPADIRLISALNLSVNESMLTGESTSITKIPVKLDENLPISEQINMLFSGTTISAGKGSGIVVATGAATEIGKIAYLMAQEDKPSTSLEKKLENIGKMIAKIVLLLAIILGIMEIITGTKILQAIISAIALSIAAIPEGLPAVVAVSLALSAKKLLKNHALLRNLAASETLGATDVICVDKTGTITTGEMRVREIYFNDQTYYFDKNSAIDPKYQKELEEIFKVAILSSNARKTRDGIVGEASEAALIALADQHGIKQTELMEIYPKISEIPFSSKRKMLTVISNSHDGHFVTSKGAAEVIINKCSNVYYRGKVIKINEHEKEKIFRRSEAMAAKGLRVFAFAYKHLESEDNPEKDLIFLGLQAIADPPRAEVASTIKLCRQAGIKVIMITGDHLLTAQTIGQEVGILGKAITGEEVDQLSEEEFAEIVEDISIFARVNPEHKLKIVKALQTRGHQVAMTGDGVNDAPALKLANIGIAMGITGTDVAKDASDMILLDDRFETIVEAVKEGRTIYDNIRKFVNYMLTSNIDEVLIIFLALILGWPLPLLPIHLLWINLVTDGLPAVALGVDPPRKNIMALSPKHFAEKILDNKLLRSLIIIGVVFTTVSLGIFSHYKDQIILAQTMVFTMLVTFDLLRIIALRHEYNLSFFSNKFLLLAIASSFIAQLTILYLPLSINEVTLQNLFRVQPLSFIEWTIIWGVGIILFIIMKFLAVKPKSLNFS